MAQEHVWHVQKYAKGRVMVLDRWNNIVLHNFVTSATPSARVDARNGSLLDCRKANLRRSDVQEYEIRGDITALIMYRRDGSTVETLIDTADLSDALRSPSPWHIDARRRVTNSDGRAHRNGTSYLHRYLMRPPDGMVVDHINGNTLDNRRANLRIVTQAQNMQNMRLSNVNTSGERGISWCKQARKWQASIWVSGRLVYLGRYADHDEAINVVRAARAKYMPFSREAALIEGGR